MRKLVSIPQRGGYEEFVVKIRDTDAEGYYWLEASCKWDGCVDIYTAGNIPFSDEYGHSTEINRDESACDDYIHICDLPEFIRMLEEVCEMARIHFDHRGEDYYDLDLDNQNSKDVSR